VSKSLGIRPHHHLFTPRGGKWIHPLLTPSYTWFHEPAARWYVNWFSCICTAHVTNTQTHRPRYVRQL